MKASGGIFLFVVFLTLQRAESFEKPGMCLDPRCNLNCNDDKDCSGNNKCCKSPCGRTCRPPVFYSRPLWNDRDCPDNLEPCCDPNNRNDDDDGCRGDRDCDRNYKCCLKGCRRECVKGTVQQQHYIEHFPLRSHSTNSETVLASGGREVRWHH